MPRQQILDVDEADMEQAFRQPATGQEVARPGHAGQVDVQISGGIITAQKVDVKRDVPSVLADIRAMAAAAGADWFYRFPVKSKDGTRSFIEGPSIKCANNVARMYGNCQIDTRLADAGETWIIYARFVDYETGFSMTRPFQQRKAQASIGTKDQDRQRDIALQIGVSKAIRNVVCNSLESFTTFAFEEAQRNIVAKVAGKPDEYRKRILAKLAEIKVEPARVERVMGRKAAEWLAPDMARIIAELQAIADNMATVDETWPPDAPAEPTRESVAKEGQAASGEAGATGATGPATQAAIGPESSVGPSGGQPGASGPLAQSLTVTDCPDGTVLYEGEDPTMFSSHLMNRAAALAKAKDWKVLDALWDENSPEFAKLPKAIADGIRETWPKPAGKLV